MKVVGNCSIVTVGKKFKYAKASIRWKRAVFVDWQIGVLRVVLRQLISQHPLPALSSSRLRLDQRLDQSQISMITPFRIFKFDRWRMYTHRFWRGHWNDTNSSAPARILKGDDTCVDTKLQSTGVTTHAERITTEWQSREKGSWITGRKRKKSVRDIGKVTVESRAFRVECTVKSGMNYLYNRFMISKAA